MIPTTDRTDEETVELIREWLQQYGLTIIAGLVLGLGAIGGYRYWQNQQETQRLNESAQLDTLLQALEKNDLQAAAAPYDALLKESSDTRRSKRTLATGAVPSRKRRLRRRPAKRGRPEKQRLRPAGRRPARPHPRKTKQTTGSLASLATQPGDLTQPGDRCRNQRPASAPCGEGKLTCNAAASSSWAPSRSC